MAVNAIPECPCDGCAEIREDVKNLSPETIEDIRGSTLEELYESSEGLLAAAALQGTLDQFDWDEEKRAAFAFAIVHYSLRKNVRQIRAEWVAIQDERRRRVS